MKSFLEYQLMLSANPNLQLNLDELIELYETLVHEYTQLVKTIPDTQITLNAHKRKLEELKNAKSSS